MAIKIKPSVTTKTITTTTIWYREHTVDHGVHTVSDVNEHIFIGAYEAEQLIEYLSRPAVIIELEHCTQETAKYTLSTERFINAAKAEMEDNINE